MIIDVNRASYVIDLFAKRGNLWTKVMTDRLFSFLKDEGISLKFVCSSQSESSHNRFHWNNNLPIGD